VVIPNLAIHLNREVNKGFEYNPHDHLSAIVAAAQDAGSTDLSIQHSSLLISIADAIDASPEDIAEIDAYLFDTATPQMIGLDDSFYLAPRVDNLAGCFTNLTAFLSDRGDRPRMLALYNHEEIGSRSAEGALSGVILSLLERTWNNLGLDSEDQEVARNRSLLVSNDATHAMHPNFASKYDEHYSCLLNGGPVIKYSANHRYATTGESAALFARACEAADVPVQRFITRSDMRSGSTVGPLGWAQTGMQSVDIGLPIWAMHSSRETGGARDIELMVRALENVLSREV
jgi:aspartyl aminopeptidase